MHSLNPAATRARSWLFDACFPFWADRARHPAGGFREKIALDGSPLDDPESRVRVQARQTYVFARALDAGWRPDRAAELVEHGVASLLGPCRRADGLLGGRVRLGEGLTKPEADLYDNAFGVLALAWASRALGRDDLAAEAWDLLRAMGERLGHPAGGYAEALPARLPRRQNPHMHVFEASTALFAATGDERHAAPAERMRQLLEARFYDPDTGRLREHFDDALEPLDGPDHDVVEPGHEFEWTALLHLEARLRDTPPRPVAGRLYAAGLSSLDARGFAPLSVRVDGGPRDPSRRTWPQTEALRAHVAVARGGDTEAAERAAALFDGLFAVHLDPAPAGAWIDHVDARGRLATQTITAATGYHLVTAFSELLEAAPAPLHAEAGPVKAGPVGAGRAS